MPKVINKKPPVLVDGFAYEVIDSVSKAALVDLVSDYIKRCEGREDMSDEEIARAFAEAMEPVCIARGDKPVNVDAMLRAVEQRQTIAAERKARIARGVPTMREVLGLDTKAAPEDAP